LPVRLYPIFPHYFINGKILMKTLFNMKCLFWSSPQIFRETVFILIITKRDMINNVRWYSCKYSLFLSVINETWIFWTDFRKFHKYQISWKSVQWEPSCFMRTDGQTDRHEEANSRFSRFCKRD
jgi:hypothetical protein